MKPRVPGGPGRRAFPSLLAVDLGPSRLFLGRFDAAALRRELEREGILRGLAARGYEEVGFRTTFESGEHRLRIRPRGGRTSLSLAWHPGLMVSAVSAQLARTLGGEDYRRAAFEALAEARFGVG